MIISYIKSHSWEKNHNYNIEIPPSTKYSYRIDENNENQFWIDAINKDIYNLIVAFDILKENGVSAPVGCNKVTGHLLFDVKMYFMDKSI